MDLSKHAGVIIDSAYGFGSVRPPNAVQEPPPADPNADFLSDADVLKLFRGDAAAVEAAVGCGLPSYNEPGYKQVIKGRLTMFRSKQRVLAWVDRLQRVAKVLR